MKLLMNNINNGNGFKVYQLKNDDIKITYKYRPTVNCHKQINITVSNNQDTILTLIDYINYLEPIYQSNHQLHLQYAYFTHILQYIIFEYYFNLTEYKHYRKIESIFNSFNNLPDLNQCKIDSDEKFNTISEQFHLYYDRKHMVRNIIFYSDTIPPIYDFLKTT